MTSIVITGHGNFATGMQSMLELVLGESENVYFVDFISEYSSQDLRKIFDEIYNKTKGDVVFLCDIAGGTPFNQASTLMYENQKHYGVVGGVNIPLILETISQLEDSPQDIQTVLNNSRQAAIENIKIFGESEERNQDSDDGI